MNPLNLTYGSNANAEAEEAEWAKGLPDHNDKISFTPELNSNKGISIDTNEKTLDDIDYLFISGLKDKTE